MGTDRQKPPVLRVELGVIQHCHGHLHRNITLGAKAADISVAPLHNQSNDTLNMKMKIQMKVMLIKKNQISHSA